MAIYLQKVCFKSSSEAENGKSSDRKKKKATKKKSEGRGREMEESMRARSRERTHRRKVFEGLRCGGKGESIDQQFSRSGGHGDHKTGKKHRPRVPESRSIYGYGTLEQMNAID